MAGERRGAHGQRVRHPDDAVIALIRPARPGDDSAIFAVLSDTFESTWKPVITPEAASRYAERASAFVAQCSRDMWVAEVDGLVVGLLYWHDDFIGSLHVQSNHARQGLGALLMDLAETAIAAAGFATARLETDTFNLSSQRFYAARGYCEADRYPDEEWDSGLTTLLLVKSLDPSDVQRGSGV